MEFKVNLEYELNINDILNKMINWYPKDNLTSAIFGWSREIAKTSSHLVLEELEPKRFLEYDELDKQALINLQQVSEFIHSSRIFNDKEKLLNSIRVERTDEILKKIDDIISSKISYQFYTYVDNGTNLIFTKSNLVGFKAKNYIKEEFTEYRLDSYSELFLAQMYIIEDFEVFNFLEYQLEVNFENDFQKFIDFYTLLKHYAKTHDYYNIYLKSEELVKDWIDREKSKLREMKDETKKSTSNNINPLDNEAETNLKKLIYLMEDIGLLKYLSKKLETENANKISDEVETHFLKDIDYKQDTLRRYIRGIILDTKPENYYTFRKDLKTLLDKKKD